MKLRRYIIFLVMFCASLSVFADGVGANPVVRAAKGVLRLIDSMAVRGIDRNYIDVPQRPWQIVVRGNSNHAYLTMSSTVDGSLLFPFLKGDYLTEPEIRSGNDMFVGVWAGYRGYGFGYMKELSGGGGGSLLTLGATGGSYGINFRRHIFETDQFDVYSRGAFSDGSVIDTTMNTDISSPVRVKSFILDGYYLFNGSHFSYSAAYDQSAYQLRSAGSLMVGGMYYYSHINYDAPVNADMIALMDNVGRVKQWQVSLGAGYAYNYVPMKGLLLSGMVMPMVTFYNRLKVYRYDSKLRHILEKSSQEDLDTYLNGSYDEIFKLLEETEKNPEVMELKPDPENPEESTNSRITLNFNARASITYNLSDWAYFNMYGQLYNFRFSHDNTHGALTEWFVNAALGLRL